MFCMNTCIMNIYTMKYKSQVSSALSSPNATPGTILRTQSIPRIVPKTTGLPTPATSVTSSGQTTRHSVALPSVC